MHTSIAILSYVSATADITKANSNKVKLISRHKCLANFPHTQAHKLSAAVLMATNILKPVLMMT